MIGSRSLLKKEEKNYGVMRAYMMMGMRLRDTTVALRDPIDIRQPGIYEKLGIMAYDYYNIYDDTNEIYHRLCDKYTDIDIFQRSHNNQESECQLYPIYTVLKIRLILHYH